MRVYDSGNPAARTAEDAEEGFLGVCSIAALPAAKRAPDSLRNCKDKFNQLVTVICGFARNLLAVFDMHVPKPALLPLITAANCWEQCCDWFAA